MRKKILWSTGFCVLSIGLVFACNVFAAEFPTISAKDLKAKMDAGEKMMVVNPMSDIEFQEVHIPGTVCIPVDTMSSSDKLPADKNMLMVTYCKGPKCIFYSLGAEALAKLGYKNIVCFKDGMPGWAQAGYPLNTDAELAALKVPNMRVEELKEKLGKVTILDIRHPSMYDMGWIEGSVKIPITGLSAKYSEIPKDKTVICVDHLGMQVTSAGKFLKKKGYTDVHFLQGGLMAWVGKGYGLTKQ